MILMLYKNDWLYRLLEAMSFFMDTSIDVHEINSYAAPYKNTVVYLSKTLEGRKPSTANFLDLVPKLLSSEWEGWELRSVTATTVVASLLEKAREAPLSPDTLRWLEVVLISTGPCSLLSAIGQTADEYKRFQRFHSNFSMNALNLQ